ncbi:MAG: autotransporter-associated beta strand repeat-containing protein [Kiritimatiellae bacterium]|nr:autotransporter-associated beta strand repeat-containing protein [Kiritimatiellia bacterium]
MGGNNNKKWSDTSGATITLSGLSAGSHTLEVYFYESDGNAYDSNGGSNYKVTFSRPSAGQMVDWWDGSSTTSGNWIQSGKDLWWYGTDGFSWPNVTDWGEQHVRIGNNHASTSHALTTDTTVKSLTFGGGASTAHTLGGSSTLTVKGGITNESSAAHSINVTKVLMGANTIVDNAGNLTISSVVDGTYTLTKKGTGTLTLSGANTYTKATTVSAGTLEISNRTGLGTTAGNTTVNSGATLKIAGGAMTASGSRMDEPFVLAGGTLQIAGTGNKTATGGITLNSTSTINTDGRNLEVATTVISGSGGLTKTGANTLTLSKANNTYQGATTIQEGTLSINTDDKLGTAPASATPGHLTFSGTANSTLSITGSGSATFNANRGIALSSSGTMTINVANGRTAVYDGIIAGSGTGTFTKAGDGTLTLGGANSYECATAVSAGTLTLNGSLASSAVTVGAATLTVGSGSHAVKSLTMNNASSVLNVGAGNTLSGSGAATLSAGTVNFDASGETVTGDTSWTIFDGGAASSISGATLSVTPATGTSARDYDWEVAANGQDIVVTYTVPISSPEVTTGDATGISTDGATLGAKVTNNGGTALTAAGIGYGTTSGNANYTSIVPKSPTPAVNADYSVEIASGLTPGTLYYYSGYADNGVAARGWGSEKSFYTKCATPTAPASLSLTRSSYQRIDLSWPAGAKGTGGGTLGYLVLRTTSDSPSGGIPTDGTVYSAGDTLGDWEVVAVQTETTLQNTGLTKDTVYYYAVYSYAGVSGQAATYAYSTGVATGHEYTQNQKPSTWSSTITVTPQGTGALVSWTAYAGANPFDGYMLVIRAGTTGTDTYPADPVDAATQASAPFYAVDDTTGTGSTVKYLGTDTSAPLSGLTPLTPYKVEVWAYDGEHYRMYQSGGIQTFKTTAKMGPDTWATGVDADEYLLNWSYVTDAKGYDVQTGSSSSFSEPVNSIVDDFQNWTTGTDEQNGNITVSYGTYYFYQAYAYSSTYSKELRTDKNGAYIRAPAVPGRVIGISYKLRAGGSSSLSGRLMTLQMSTNSGTSWISLATAYPTNGNTTYTPITYTPTLALPPNAMFRWLNTATSDSDKRTICLDEISIVWCNEEGHSKSVTGLTSGNTYYARVRKTPNGDWSDVLGVKAGVMPSGLTASQIPNGVSFSWSGLNSPAGYAIQVSKTAAPATWADKEAGTSALALDSFGSKQWKYIGTAVTASGSSALKNAPGYYSGHIPGGRGNGIESTDFPIAGMTGVRLSYKIGSFNLNNGTQEDGRVHAYYRIDDGPWCFMGSDVPAGTASGATASQKAVQYDVPQGALDSGNTVAFKVVAPNAHPNGSSYFISPSITELKVSRVSKGSGDYSGTYSGSSWSSYKTVDTTTTETSYEVTGLTPGERVYFRVQALQGSVASPTARSVWLEASEEAGAFAGPTLLAANPVGRYGFTANWTAAEEATGGYQIQWTRCGGSGAGDTTVSSCANGTLTAGGDTGWRYLRPSGSSYPKWAASDAVLATTAGHNMMLGASSPSQNPAIASPDMDLSGYTGGYVEFSHWSRHASYYAPDAKVTLWYRTSANGSTWGAWTEGATTPNLSAASPIVTEQLQLPAGALGQAHVQIKLSTDNSLSGHGDPGNGVYTGPMVKDITVHGTGSGTPDYSDSCAQGHSEIIDVPAGTTLKAFTGLAAGTPYYYHVRTVVSGSPNTYSDWSEGQVTTAAPQLPPAEVWAEGIRQNHMTVAWSEAPDATAATVYKYEVTSCGAGSVAVEAVAPSPTEQDVAEGDDWSYVGGGTAPSSQQAETYGIAKETYPAWCNESTLVLAGEGSPGLESKAFSTVGATAGEVAFYHGRWYNPSELAKGAVTVSYSLDGGDNWTVISTTAYSDLPSDGTASKLRTIALPAGALGKANVMVRLEAKSAGLRSTDSVPVGCAIGSAKVTVTRPAGNYTGSGCVVASGAGLSHDQLAAEISGLTPNMTYYFHVAASDGTQYGDWTEGLAKTLAAPDAPNAPTQLSAGRHSLTMTWNAVAGAETYTIYYYGLDSTCGTLVESVSGLTGTTYTRTGLDGNKTYYFKVQAHADGTESALSAKGSGTTAAALTAPRISATNILDTSMRLEWDYVGDTTYTLSFGPAASEGTGSYTETMECPAETLGRSDKGKGWFYIGGNASYPKYYTGTGADHGHVLAYTAGGEPGIQSRWFSTWGAKSASLEFLHGRYGNGGANSALDAYYSVDGGASWVKFGSATASTATAPTDARSIQLPDAALGRRSVAVRLVAPDAVSGNAYGAEIQGLKMVVDTGNGGTRSGFPKVLSDSEARQGYMDFTGLTAGTRYWFTLAAAEGGDSETSERSAATRTRTTGAVLSQGFEGASGNGALDAESKAWGYTMSWKYVSGGGDASGAAGKPTVGVVDGVNPLYGDRALRLSGSAGATVFGVVDFDNFSAGAGSSLTVTIPFAAQDLGKNDYLYVAYSSDNGSSWHAPAGTTAVTTMGGVQMGRIGIGGSDVLNQNWPYNRGVNATTRPQGDAFTFTVDGVSQLKVRVAFCGQSGGANHYYWIDEVKLTRNPGDVQSASATAQESGGILLEWTPPAGGQQGVVILRGRDERHIPAGPLDLDNLPHGYEIVMNGNSKYWPPSTTSTLDTEVLSGWKYYYYFYGAIDNGDGSYMLRSTPLTANDVVKGMVNAIASMGWDGWDVHPWPYTKGRVTNPGPDGDNYYWAENGQSSGGVQFIAGTDANPTWEVAEQYTTLYGNNQQMAPTDRKQYYGDKSFRLSGGGGYDYTCNAAHGGTTMRITTNNAAIQFENIDLSGYKNVEFSLHFAAHTGIGGDDMHVAISTDGGDTWMAVSRTNSAMWKTTQNTYGMKVGDGNRSNGGEWDFYYEDYGIYEYDYMVGDKLVHVKQTPTPEGNPYWLRVPDSVTQFMARVMFFDSNGGNRRDYSYYIDEVRLVGEEALRTPHPTMENIASNRFTVKWDAIPDATDYDVRVTKCPAAGDDAVKLQQAFVLNVVSDGWTTNTAGHATMSTTFDHTGSGYGLSMGGNNTELTSPEVGAARQVAFWSKAVSANSNSKLLVQVSEDGTTWETLTNYTAATSASVTQIGSAWVQKTVDLPHRQWAKVRFRMERSGSSTAGNFYVDDIQILGGGDYSGASCLVKELTGVTGTSADFVNGTGGVTLTPGTAYYVEVRANGAPGGYLTHSPWGETGDYTSGTVTLQPDGFEMVRLWGTASSSADVLIATSAGDDPIGTPAGGVTYSAGDTLPGGGTVLARWTSNYTENDNFEHVVPANAQVNYAVFWKHGPYYEGRYETNFWMGKYGSPVAEAFAQTNGAAPAEFVSNGMGWASGGAWSAWDDSASHISMVRGSAYPYGLLGSNQLFGAGGNMIKFDMGTAASELKVRAGRDFATPFTSKETWFMFTVRCQYGADDINKMWGMQLLGATGDDAYKNVIASIGKIKDLTGTTGEAKLSVDTSSDTTGAWLGGGYPLRTAVTHANYGLKDYGNSGNTNAIWTIVGKYVRSTGKLSVKAYYTPDVSSASGGVFGPKAAAPTSFDITDVSAAANKDITGVTLFGYGWNGDLYFDEIRFGPSWSSLIEEPSPPKPVTAVRAIPDGKELVRLDWTYAAHDEDYPDATGVLVLDKATAWTAEDIAAAKPVNGQPYNIGATIGGATVAYLGEAGWTAGGKNYQDLVVEPGSTHYYRVYAHSSFMYTNGVAASGTAPSQYPVTMETYRAGEHVVPFSYTNATSAVGSWQGGAGFTGGWTGTGTWTAMLPLEQPGSNPSSDPVLADVTGYPARAGNAVMVTDPGNGGSATLTRALDTPVTAAKTNFYAAFMMAYQWKGANKWAGVSILNANDDEIGFAGKGSGANWNTLAVASDLAPHWSQTDLLPYDPSNADSSGALSHAYLVVMRYNFANRTLSAIAVPCGGEMPEYEPTQWDVSWQVREGLGSSVAKIQLNVGSAAGGTIGYCWFDELRWGTSWEDIVSGKCADGVDVAEWRVPGTETPLAQTYLGNSADIGVKSHPKGFGQEAWLTVDWSGNGTGVVTNQLAWLKNVESGTPTYTWWSNTVQMVKTGKVGGSSSVDYPATAKVTALNTDCEETRTVTQVTVLPLQPPTGVGAAKDAVKTNSVINVSWTPWQGTLTGVDTLKKDVLIVRFSGTTEAAAREKAALAANQPVQGRAYSAGDSIGEGTVVWRGGDGGAVTTTAARGLQPETSYAFAVYTENYSYYSVAAFASATTDEGGHDITVDGDLTDWYGEAPDTLNTAWVNLGEFIWKDKTGEERHSAGSGDSTVGNPSSDIDEFRIYADADWVYFLVKMTNITDVAKPYVAVGVDSRKKASSEAMNWLGDESATTIGSNYWANTENEHYPRWQLNVHQVSGQGTQVEQYAADGSEWFAPVGTVTTTEDETPETRGWAAAIGSGEGKAVEFRVARSDIGLAGIEDGATVTQRFTVASFVNTGVWNNQGGATAEIYGGTSKAVDALGIAPQRPTSKPDNDYLLSSWDEDIADGNIDFWVDVAFSRSGVVENQRPSAPSQLVFPTENARLKSSPTFEWKRGSDTDGKVTGYMLEVSTDPDFDDLNGTVALRVNVPALVTGETDSTKYHYAWNGAHQQTMYYWRVRSRDTGGMLSAPASGQFWVDEDGDGPVAVLKYVGTDVAGYMAGNYAQQEKLWPESLLSVTDAEIERVVNDPSLKFGFVIEWSDPNGVYATNHLHDGAGANTGKWAWNISSSDGRVSPNWDLVEFHTTFTDRDTQPPAGLVTDTTGHGEWTTNYWDKTGCWGYQWGYDEAFSVGAEGTADDQTRGENGDQTIINLVRSAFDMHAFDTNVDYYLTVSAEDCTTWKESGYDWWEYGTWKSFKAPTDPDAPGDRYSSGWCADGPNRARNVTTNQLLEIRVRDNDVTAPGASLNRWSTTSFIASTNNATPTFSNPEKQLTRESGTGLPTFVTTDGELAGRPLALHFNVYDSSMTGIKLGTAETESVAGLVGSHTMTNSWLVRTQQVGDAEPDVMTNRANYVAAKSTVESSGTGAGTVLTWYWPTMDAENIAHFWATNAVDEGGVLTETVNTLALNLWDLDNNRDGDQMGAETVMGYLKVRDDDTSAPVARDMHTLGTGTNRVVFGQLARWPMNTKNNYACVPIQEGALVGADAVMSRISGGTETAQTPTWYPTYSMHGISLNTKAAIGKGSFAMTVGSGVARLESEALSFKIRVSAKGATNVTVTAKVGSGAEKTLGSWQIEKALDENGDHAETEEDVTLVYSGDGKKVVATTGQTVTFTVSVDGAEAANTTLMFSEFKVYGFVQLPPGVEVTDHDMVRATWTNSVDVSDGAQGKTDTLRSGLWLAHSEAYTGEAAAEPVPKYVLEDASTHEAITNGLVVSGLTAAFENEVADGDFETDFTLPGSEWSLGGGAAHVTDATGGNHVLKFTANGASATKVLDLGDVTGATAIRAKCDQVEYKGGRVRLTYVWLDENGDEVEAESAAHSTANDGWEIWVPRNQSVSAANLEAGTVRQLEVTFTREDSSNEADLDDIEVYAEVVTAGGTRTVPATPVVDDFESGTSGWELSDGASVELGGAIRTGSYAVEVSATADVVQNWVAVTAAEGLLQGSMLGSVWTRGAAAAVEVRFFKTQAETEATALTEWLTVDVPATVDWARTEIPATIAELSETGLRTVYGLVRVRGGGDGATFVDDLEMIVVGWGSPTAGATAENGTKSAALQFTTANLVDESGKLSLPGGVATLPKNYNFGVQVADYDLDRTQDHLVTTSGGSFRLYDDDATAPQAGMMFGGSLGVRTGDAKAPYAGAGTDVDVRLSDGAMVAAGSSAQVAFDLDFYDFSGWDTLGLSWYPATAEGGAHTLVWTNGSSGSMTSAVKTKGNGEENSPSATNTVTVPVSTLWGLSAVQDAFRTGIVSNWMAATITDKDADRYGDELVWTNKVGMLTILDDDVKAPKLGSTNRWPRQMFVGKGAVGDLKDHPDNYADYQRDWPRGTTYENHVPASGRTTVVYDGELRTLATENLFIEVDMNDPSDSMKGRSATGLRRGIDKTVSGQSNGLGDTYTTTNTWLGLFAESGTNASSYASATPVVDATDKYSSADETAEDHTKGSLGVMWNVWKWTENLTPEAVATWLPSESESGYRDLRAVVHAYDADTDRPGDQLESVLVGQVIRVRDDDTVAPGEVGNIMNNDVDITYTGSTPLTRTDPNVKWTNTLASMTLTFTAATDGAKGADDLNVSGIGGYRVADATPTAATDGTALACTVSEGTVTANLDDSGVTEGLTAKYVFAVDADDDRPGDALAGPAKGFVLAYDRTVPTTIGKSSENGGHVVASPDTTDDPTTQFDVTWPAKAMVGTTEVFVGPDALPNASQADGTGTDVYSPWETYKLYYSPYDVDEVPDGDSPFDEGSGYVYTNFIATEKYKEWPSVSKTSVAADVTAPARCYAALENRTTVSTRLYDLDFDQEYIVVVVGVDKAGNEGAAGIYSWATNNTIKFAVTQGVMRARAAVQAAFPTNNNMKPGDKGAVALYWKAAGQTDGVGAVRKKYDLIYRDAKSFNESSNNTWSLVGTVQTNWFVDADALGQSANLFRFYRAAYENRWRSSIVRTNDNEVVTTAQRPLMSEDVYAMTAVPLLKGMNYVSLHGFGVGGGQTNTIGAIFGTDPAFWPVGGAEGESVRLDVYTTEFAAGAVRAARSYYLVTNQNGQADWYLSGGGKSTDVIDQDIFTHGVAIELPAISDERRDLVVTNNGVAQNAIYWHPVLLVPTNNILPEADSTDSFSVPVVAGSVRAGVKWNLIAFNLPVACHPSQLGLESGFGASTATSPTMVCDILYAYDSVNKKLRDDSGMFLDKDGNWRSIYGSYPIVPSSTKPFYPNDMIVILSRGGSNWTWTYSPTNFYTAPTRWGGW